MKEVFSERLRELRQERGLGQVQLAKELDVGKSVISLWELGKCEPTLSKLVAMARFFGVGWRTDPLTPPPKEGARPSRIAKGAQNIGVVH